MHEPIQRSIDKLLDSYEQIDKLYNSEGHNLPSTHAMAGICETLLSILFPGFHDEEPVHHNFLPRLTQHRLMTLSEKLENQIARALQCKDCAEAIDNAHGLLARFLDQLPPIRTLLHSDVQAAYDGDPAAINFDEIILAYPSIQAIAIQRMAHALYEMKVPYIPRMMTEWAHSRTGIDIHPGATIGTHFFIDHGTGVVIGETCHIGNHVKLYHGVTLGARSMKKDDTGKIAKGGKRHPNVEDHVTIYPNSTILGGETTIGAHSTIGGNVFLMQSVPENSLVYYEETQLKIIAKRPRPDTITPEQAEHEIEWFI